MTEPVYEYKKVDVTKEHPPTIEAAANRWALMGWLTVTAIPARHRSEHTSILIMRKKEGYVLLSDKDYADLKARAERPLWEDRTSE